CSVCLLWPCLSCRDAWGRRLVEVVAMDALHYSQPSSQYCLASVTRELNKAYVGFHSRGAPQRHLPAVATGNWGCGAFRGDPHLKSLIQLMAAAQAGRDLCYFTFGDTALRDSIWEMYRFLQRRRATTGDILALLKRYEQLCAEKSSSQLSLYSFIYSAFKGADGSDTDQQIEGLQTYLEGTTPLIADHY
ncbi:PREDICTED: poly(ADP-ribose) glycohydrolase-like, partial [Priapulus caudatus]|uniref:Poly(ADP-ribose) glycohydrolase-like n=1 Tax=Priapulus caudatus TaxID=37621 RepID=A0ABM1F058_PRICU